MEIIEQRNTHKMKKTTGSQIRILVVDHYPIIRFGLVSKLNVESDLCIVGEASSCGECCDQIASLFPDVVLIDLSLSDDSGSDALTKIRDTQPDIALVIYAASDNDWLVTETIRMGIQGYVIKDAPIERVVHAIRTVGQGGSYLDPVVTSVVMGFVGRKQERRQFKQRILTERETSIIEMLASGKSNKEIAEMAKMGERTAKHHVSVILQKLQATNRTEAVVNAIKLGLVNIT